jgi:hypothetical protein
MIKIVATGIVWFIIGFYFGFIFDNNFVEDSCEEIKQSQSPFTYAAPKCLKKGSVVELEASEANFKDGVWRVEYSTGEKCECKDRTCWQIEPATEPIKPPFGNNVTDIDFDQLRKDGWRMYVYQDSSQTQVWMMNVLVDEISLYYHNEDFDSNFVSSALGPVIQSDKPWEYYGNLTSEPAASYFIDWEWVKIANLDDQNFEFGRKCGAEGNIYIENTKGQTLLLKVDNDKPDNGFTSGTRCADGTLFIMNKAEIEMLHEKYRQKKIQERRERMIAKEMIEGSRAMIRDHFDMIK